MKEFNSRLYYLTSENIVYPKSEFSDSLNYIFEFVLLILGDTSDECTIFHVPVNEKLIA